MCRRVFRSIFKKPENGGEAGVSALSSLQAQHLVADTDEGEHRVHGAASVVYTSALLVCAHVRALISFASAHTWARSKPSSNAESMGMAGECVCVCAARFFFDKRRRQNMRTHTK